MLLFKQEDWSTIWYLLSKLDTIIILLIENSFWRLLILNKDFSYKELLSSNCINCFGIVGEDRGHNLDPPPPDNMMGITSIFYEYLIS